MSASAGTIPGGRLLRRAADAPTTVTARSASESRRFWGSRTSIGSIRLHDSPSSGGDAVAALVAGCLLAIKPCRTEVCKPRRPAARRSNGRMISRSRACRQATPPTEAAFRQEIAVSIHHYQLEERLTLDPGNRHVTSFRGVWRLRRVLKLHILCNLNQFSGEHFGSPRSDCSSAYRLRPVSLHRRLLPDRRT